MPGIIHDEGEHTPASSAELPHLPPLVPEVAVVRAKTRYITSCCAEPGANNHRLNLQKRTGEISAARESLSRSGFPIFSIPCFRNLSYGVLLQNPEDNLSHDTGHRIQKPPVPVVHDILRRTYSCTTDSGNLNTGSGNR